MGEGPYLTFKARYRMMWWIGAYQFALGLFLCLLLVFAVSLGPQHEPKHWMIAAAGLIVFGAYGWTGLSLMRRRWRALNWAIALNVLLLLDWIRLPRADLQVQITSLYGPAIILAFVFTIRRANRHWEW